MNSPRIKVCYLPGRESSYIRTRTLQQALGSLPEVELLDCSYPHKKFIRYFASLIKFLRYYRRSDVILIGFCGQPLVILARILTQKPIVFDAFISIYETLVYERRRLKPGSLLAKSAHFLDDKSCRLADIILLDTHAHIDYFVNEYRLPPDKFRKVPATCGDLKAPLSSRRPRSQFLVHFHGEFQSLHGAEYIVNAAKEVPEAQFRLIGPKGKNADILKKLAESLQLKNIEFLPYQPYDKLLGYIQEADLCLGLFGGTPKANMVIPNKVYEYSALGKPTISQDSDAINEIFTNYKDIILCEPCNPSALAAKIQECMRDRNLLTNISQEAIQTFSKHCSLENIARELRSALRFCQDSRIK